MPLLMMHEVYCLFCSRAPAFFGVVTIPIGCSVLDPICALIELASEAVRITDDEDHDEGEGLFCRVQIGVEEADWLKKDDQQAVMLEEPVSLLPLESLL